MSQVDRQDKPVMSFRQQVKIDALFAAHGMAMQRIPKFSSPDVSDNVTAESVIEDARKFEQFLIEGESA